MESKALSDIAAERERQINAEGWTPEHDDKHRRGDLAMAAALYASPSPLFTVSIGEGRLAWQDPWPWFRMDYPGRAQAGDPPTVKVLDGDGREKHDKRRKLVIAGALIVAEIERLDRATLKDTPAS